MVLNSNKSSFYPERTWRSLDRLVKSNDEDRWISSRYAEKRKRLALISLYAFNIELAKIQKAISESSIREIRFQWWRDALSELQSQKSLQRHDVVWGLDQLTSANTLKYETLSKLLEDHAAQTSRSEVTVMEVAASIFAPNHQWENIIRKLAENFAKSRAGEAQEVYEVSSRVPLAIRPAVNHAVLRHSYASGKIISSFHKRIKICKSMLTGYI